MAAGMRASASAAEMHAAMGMAMPDMQAWGLADLLSLFLMWAVMMVGMMLRSAAPVDPPRRRHLMVLLFAAGVMNLVWVAAIAAFVLAEKLAPQGPWFSRFAGVLLFAWGTYVVVSLPGAR